MTTKRNEKLSRVRATLHNLTCQGFDCSGDNDHARRTQHGSAVKIVDSEFRVTAVIKALHAIAHPMCDVIPDETHFRIRVDHPAYVAMAKAVE